jgi:hypothetical protein
MKITKYFSQDSCSPLRNLNPGTPSFRNSVGDKLLLFLDTSVVSSRKLWNSYLKWAKTNFFLKYVPFCHLQSPH